MAHLRRVRGAYRRTARKIARATAMVALAASLLGIPLAGTSAAASITFGPPQTNPFGLGNVGELSVPSFGDVDGDGDLDVFIGGHGSGSPMPGEVHFFRNTGTANAPAFAAEVVNPFSLTPGPLQNAAGLGQSCPATAAAFVDIDGDGVLDAFVGQKYGVDYFRHDPPNVANPTFAHITPSPFANPVSGTGNPDACYEPSFADIDGDGDLDAFAGAVDCHGDPLCSSPTGVTLYWQNVGTATAPSFVAAAPAWLSGLHDYGRAPTFGDIDGDGDLDAFIGDVDGTIHFFENVGDRFAPAFAAPVTDPFGLVDVGDASAVTLADIDGDGDLDLFVGRSNGDTVFFENRTACTPLPPDASTEPVDAKSAQKCTRAIGKEVSKFVAAKTKALQKCEDAKLAGAHGDPCPSSTASEGTPARKADDLIEKAKGKVAQQIAKACGGADKACGTVTPDGEEAPSAIGFAFSGAACPDFQGSGECAAPIHDCNDVTACVECIAGEAVQDALTVDYAGLAASPDSDLLKCQRAIGKETTKFLLAKDKLVQKCWDKALAGKPVGSTTCPDFYGTGPSLKAALKIQQAEQKKVLAICKACGGADKQCDAPVDTSLIVLGGGAIGGSGGGDDLLPTSGTAECPHVVLPTSPGTDCGTLDDLDGVADRIDSLREMILCADCVSEYQADCLDAAARPQPQPYPAQPRPYPCECTKNP